MVSARGSSRQSEPSGAPSRRRVSASIINEINILRNSNSLRPVPVNHWQGICFTERHWSDRAASLFACGGPARSQGEAPPEHGVSKSPLGQAETVPSSRVTGSRTSTDPPLPRVDVDLPGDGRLQQRGSPVRSTTPIEGRVRLTIMRGVAAAAGLLIGFVLSRRGKAPSR